MFGGKLIHITDSNHGAVQISRLEKEIISTQIFNRLHSINQNSTVYLTYPSNHTKRFVHSLGTMHLAGRMLYQSIVNANYEDSIDFLRTIRREIITLLNKEDKKILRTLYGNEVKIVENLKDDFNYIFTDDPLYNCSIPSVFIKNLNEVTSSGKKKEYSDLDMVFVLIYQATRCAALLHDVGHPPYSHVTEYALKELLNWVENEEIIIKHKKTPFNENDLPNLTFSEKKKIMFYETLTNGENIEKDLHEAIGLRIAERLLDSVVISVAGPEDITEELARTKLFYDIVSMLTICILNNNPPIFEDVHRIIDGSIDCDRLDYVTRDMVGSGYVQGKINHERLISCMKLVKEERGLNKFVFSFDIRSLNTIEDFFMQRWSLYRNINYHHRVSKTGALLRGAIINISKRYLEDNATIIENIGNRVLQMHISGLWEALKDAIADKDYFDTLLQWDDSWLLTVLRHEYYNHNGNFHKEAHIQLEELLSNKKNYFSIIKRMDHFLEIDQEAFSTFITAINTVDDKKVNNFIEKLEELGRFTKTVIGNIDKFKKMEAEEIKTHWKSSASLFGFFLEGVHRITKVGIREIPTKNIFIDLVENEIENLKKDDPKIFDCIVTFNDKIKFGLETQPYIHRRRGNVAIGELSRISYHLKRSREIFPVFYVYISFSKDIHRMIKNDVEYMHKLIQEYRVIIGKRIGGRLIRLLADEGFSMIGLE
jgi:HD superfamily phosphohydrolase